LCIVVLLKCYIIIIMTKRKRKINNQDNEGDITSDFDKLYNELCYKDTKKEKKSIVSPSPSSSKKKGVERKFALQKYEDVASTTTEEGEDDIPKIVNAPTPANKLVEIQVKMLMDYKYTWNLLDVFLQFDKYNDNNNNEEDNDTNIYDAFQNTDICKNLTTLLRKQEYHPKKEEDEKKSKSLASKKIITFGKVCKLITNLICTDIKYFGNQFVIQDDGVCGAEIVQRMKENPSNVHVQDHGCNALRNMSCVENITDAILKTIFCNTDALDVMSSAMKHFPNNMDLQESVIVCGIKIIGSSSISDDENITTQMLIENYNFVELTLKTLESYFDKDQIAKPACKFLKLILATTINNGTTKAKSIIRENGGTVLLAKIEDHYQKLSNTKIVKSAVEVMKLMYQS